MHRGPQAARARGRGGRDAPGHTGLLPPQLPRPARPRPQAPRARQQLLLPGLRGLAEPAEDGPARVLRAVVEAGPGRARQQGGRLQEEHAQALLGAGEQPAEAGGLGRAPGRGRQDVLPGPGWRAGEARVGRAAGARVARRVEVPPRPGRAAAGGQAESVGQHQAPEPHRARGRHGGRPEALAARARRREIPAQLRQVVHGAAPRPGALVRARRRRRAAPAPRLERSEGRRRQRLRARSAGVAGQLDPPPEGRHPVRHEDAGGAAHRLLGPGVPARLQPRPEDGAARRGVARGEGARGADEGAAEVRV
mmetsp:Transcript_27254/g.77031  ORF Transcript_27254/g.77031 Transcript_27254/m.77031 type:complete len:308 (-) Transcript_27254:1423-2346(-)